MECAMMSIMISTSVAHLVRLGLEWVLAVVCLMSAVCLSLFGVRTCWLHCLWQLCMRTLKASWFLTMSLT